MEKRTSAPIPAPWKIIKLNGETWINPKRKSDEYALIAHVHNPGNARLIVRAVNLYEELIDLAELVAAGNTEFEGLERAANAVLAKTKGV